MKTNLTRLRKQCCDENKFIYRYNNSIIIPNNFNEWKTNIKYLFQLMNEPGCSLVRILNWLFKNLKFL